MPTHRTSSLWSLPIVLVFALGLAARLDAQRPPFRTGVALVPLTVTVTDGRGQYVTNLTGSDFTVFDEGVPQPLAFFASEQVPIDLALVIDVSSSMGRHLPIVRKAASGLLRSLRAHDQVTVAALTGSLGILQPLTTDRARIEAAVRDLSASGETALYNGLYVMLKEFERERTGKSDVRRQAIVLLSDGLDTASHFGADEVMALAQRVGVNIYVIAVPGVGSTLGRANEDARTLHARHEMRALARHAGGRSFFPQAVMELPGIYDDIARELENQYELGYFPAAGGDGEFRRVTVRVENANARTRSGYYASAPGAPGSDLDFAARHPP
jgi:Ca-activated chloride channel homolog